MPDNALVDDWEVAQHERLARWLGQRYSRPAIADEDYEQISMEWASQDEHNGDAAMPA